MIKCIVIGYFRGTCASVECWRGTYFSVEMLKGTCSSVGIMKGCMLIERLGNPGLQHEDLQEKNDQTDVWRQDRSIAKLAAKNHRNKHNAARKLVIYPGTYLGSAGPEAILVLWAPNVCDLFGCLSEKRGIMPSCV